jgi:hypothetical protein
LSEDPVFVCARHVCVVAVSVTPFVTSSRGGKAHIRPKSRFGPNQVVADNQQQLQWLSNVYSRFSRRFVGQFGVDSVLSVKVGWPAQRTTARKWSSSPTNEHSQVHEKAQNEQRNGGVRQSVEVFPHGNWLCRQVSVAQSLRDILHETLERPFLLILHQLCGESQTQL